MVGSSVLWPLGPGRYSSPRGSKTGLQVAPGCSPLPPLHGGPALPGTHLPGPASPRQSKGVVGVQLEVWTWVRHMEPACHWTWEHISPARPSLAQDSPGAPSASCSVSVMSLPAYWLPPGQVGHTPPQRQLLGGQARDIAGLTLRIGPRPAAPPLSPRACPGCHTGPLPLPAGWGLARTALGYCEEGPGTDMATGLGTSRLRGTVRARRSWHSPGPGTAGPA